MYYSETKVILGGLAHVPILIFIVNFIQGKFEAIEAKVSAVRKEDVKSSEVSEVSEVKTNAAEVIKEELKSGEVKSNAAEVIEEEVRSEEVKAIDVKDDTE